MESLNETSSTCCPQCYTPIKEPHAPNVTIIQYVDAQRPSLPRPAVRQPNSVPAALCQYCNKEPASLICFECLAPAGVKFCCACSEKEHNRGFGPAQNYHKPKPISQAFLPTSVPKCQSHPSMPSQLFSLQSKSFACDLCCEKPGFDASNYLTIDSAMHAVSTKLPALVQKMRNQVEAVGRTQAELNEAVRMLDLEKGQRFDELAATFANFEQALRKRRDVVMKNVEQEAMNRKKLLEEQRERVEVARGVLDTSIVQANMLQQAQDYSQLQQATALIDKMEGQLLQKDPSLCKGPIMTGNIPCYVAPDFLGRIETLGQVGGADIPKAFTCCHDKGLLLLKWQAPGNSGNCVKQYEIEYEPVEQSLQVARDGPTVMTVPSKAEDTCMQKRLDGIIPGMKYSFRIRTLNTAGWGCWSASMETVFQNLPLEIGYTGEIVKLVIPEDRWYLIVAKGASAEDGEKRCSGGKGAIIAAKFALKRGEVLEILCGGMSTRVGPSSGGGGGTFVALAGRTNLLVAAGGGGGTRGHDQDDCDGRDANTEEDGLAGVGREWAHGGVGGGCGCDALFTGPPWGHGGAGYNQASTTAMSFVHGGTKGSGGGFGGGGAVGTYGGGGGGGYSGGGGGRGGGGGGSYVREDGMDVKKMVGNVGHGSVNLDYCY